MKKLETDTTKMLQMLHKIKAFMSDSITHIHLTQNRSWCLALFYPAGEYMQLGYVRLILWYKRLFKYCEGFEGIKTLFIASSHLFCVCKPSSILNNRISL